MVVQRIVYFDLTADHNINTVNCSLSSIDYKLFTVKSNNQLKPPNQLTV